MSDKPTAPQGDEQKAPEVKKGPENTPVVHKKTSGMAVAGLVLGLIALLSCWIPLLNVLTTPFAVLGIVFAIIGIVATAPSKPKGGRGIAIAGTVLCVISLVVPVAMYGSAASSSSADKSSSSAIEQTKSDDNAKDESADTIEAADDSSDDAESADVKIVSCKKDKDYDGKNAVVVTFKWTNNTDESVAFFTQYSVNVYVDGEQTDTAISSYKDWDKYDGTLKKIKKGKTQTVKKMYEWDGKSDVEVEVMDGWFSSDPVASKTFKF